MTRVRLRLSNFKTALMTIGAMCLFTLATFAENYTVANTSKVLYTNASTQLYADADLSTLTVAAKNIASDLPVQVTGITSNGWFRTSIANETWYIPAGGLDSKNIAGGTGLTEEQVYSVIMSMQSKYPTGMAWGNYDRYYGWKGGTYIGGYGCAAFAFELSDLAFGNTIAKISKDYSNIRVGDILRINNNTHSVIVLQVKTNSVVVAEANYHGMVLWGRELSMSAIQDSQSYIMTRYTS